MMMNDLSRIALISFWVLTGSLFAAPEYQQVFSGSEIRPDKIGARCTFSGAGLAGTLKPGEKSGVWVVEPGKGEKERWSALGIEFASPRTVPSIGFRMEISLDAPIKVGFEPRINRTPGKGFWDTQWLGRRSVELPAGKQVLEYTWGELGVKNADWPKVNAVSLAIGDPRRMEIYSFGLIYPEQNGGEDERTVNWLDSAAGETNPVARPFDKLSGVHSLRAGEGLSSVRDMGNLPEGGEAARWKVAGDPAIRSWAVMGFGFADPIDPPLSGLRFEVFFPHETALGIQLCKNFDREKGFYIAQKSGSSKKLTFPAGKQVIELDWNAFGVPAADLNLINSVEFIADRAMEMLILKVDLVFADPEKATAYRMVRDRKLDELHRVLLEGLAARGVDWLEGVKGRSAQETEPLIWQAVQLSAQREQLGYWKNLHGAETAEALQKRNDMLIAAGGRGQFDSLREKIGVLQTEIDSYVDDALAVLPSEKRRFRYDAESRHFRYPDGRMFRMFGPHFFRALYRPGPLSGWRPWDIRYLAGIGFNGIRLHCLWSDLEPEQGKFSPDMLKKLKDISREAERYGFGISFDLHWPYPEWFVKGKPGFEHGGKLSKANSYHWPEALTGTWRRIGQEFAGVPNIIAFEVPTNETPIGNGKGGLADSPYLLMRWNEFLKSEYTTRAKLQNAWGIAGQYALGEDENWESRSIRPLGFQGDSSPDQAYECNPRFYDHLRFTAMMQKELSGAIVDALRESIPEVQGMFQRTIGDMWDSSPVPVNYHSILTCAGENVLIGTHYNMGGLQARKAATLTLGSYDSEQQMEGSRKAVERHVALGLGFCPFAFHYRGGGGMLLADDDWHLKPEVGYLPKLATHIRTFRPEPKIGERVAVIVNSRQEAGSGAKLGDLVTELERRNCEVGVFESLRVIGQPELLKGYALVVTSTGYMDLRLFDILREQFDGKVLLHGRLDLDAYAREVLPAYLVENKLFLKTPAVRRAAELSGRLDLAGNWEFSFLGKNDSPVKSVPMEWGKSETMRVPGLWGETGMTGSLRYRIGDGAYRKKIAVPADWQERPLKLKLGAVDDLDWVFWNGKLIGHTGENTPNYWMAAREYRIPAEVTRFDGENELVIVVRNLRDDGGIWKSPVEISGNTSGVMVLRDGKEFSVPCGGSTTLLSIEVLAENVELLAHFRLPEAGESAALLRQGRFHWYFNDQELNFTAGSGDRSALDSVME